MLGRRSQEKQAEQSVADKLIAVFASKSPAEWRKLIAFSKQWPTLADSVLERLDDRMAAEANPSDKSKLKKLARRLRSVHEELKEYSELLQSFQERGVHEWESIVAANRPSFTSEFFQHAENLIKAAHNSPEDQEDLAEMVTKILALVTAFDEVSANQEAMQDAALQFDGLLQVGSLEEADGKIDELAAAGKLDPALLLTMAKAYAAAKETDKTQEEVKDIMAHLYFKAKESFAQMQPPEVRILKHLLSLDDPRQRSDELAAAFQPGPELETKTHDFLSTTPQKLLAAMDLILETYERSAGSAGMLGQAGALMNPEVIKTLRDIQAIVRKSYT
ncbi:g5672 [Coccomyxa elongata]